MAGPSFRPPDFNLNVYIWHGLYPNPILPPPGPPDVTTVGQLADFSKTVVALALNVSRPLIQIRVPKGTDVRSYQWATTGDDICEVPADSGRYYSVVSVDDVGKGYDNEYRLAYAVLVAAPTPLP